MRPTTCPRCMAEFEANPRLQQRAREINYFDGPEEAREYVDDALAVDHERHAA